jgi:hypothetical protein
MRRLLPLLALPLLATSAFAAPLPSIDMRSWRPSADPRAGVVLEPVTPPEHLQLNLALLTNYAFRPVSLEPNAATLRPVEHHLGADLIAGLGLGSRTSVGLGLPMVLYQQGTDPLPSGVVSNGVPVAAVGDLWTSGKITLRSNDHASGQAGLGLALLTQLTFPTGNRNSFASESGVTCTARFLAEYTYVVFTVQGSLGYKLRTNPTTWPDASLGGVVFGDEIPWTFGASLRPAILGLDAGNRQTWEIGLRGSVPAGPVGPFGTGKPGSARLSPVLLAASNRIELGHFHDTYVLVGVDFGLNDAYGVPAFRAMLGLGWTPRSHDKDNDGVPDDVDQCEELAEDRDGIDDDDGCPEDDADDDGIQDQVDACPKVKGEPDPDPRKNGCPHSR